VGGEADAQEPAAVLKAEGLDDLDGVEVAGPGEDPFLRQGLGDLPRGHPRETERDRGRAGVPGGWDVQTESGDGAKSLLEVGGQRLLVVFYGEDAAHDVAAALGPVGGLGALGGKSRADTGEELDGLGSAGDALVVEGAGLEL